MTSLPRTLGLRDLILLTVGSVIGSGIFLVPGAVLRQWTASSSGHAGLLAGGGLSLLGALTTASSARETGGGPALLTSAIARRFPAFCSGGPVFRHQQRRGRHAGVASAPTSARRAADAARAN